MSVLYPDILDMQAYAAASPANHIVLNVLLAAWPKEAEAYAEPGSKCVMCRRECGEHACDLYNMM